MNTNDRIALIKLASKLPAKSVERRAILSGLSKEAGILDKLFARYRKDHPNSKAPPQSLKDKAAELEKAEKEKAEKEKPEKEKAEKAEKEKAEKEKAEKEKAEKEKAEKEKAEKEKSDKKDKEVSELSDKDLDEQLKEHEGKSEKRQQKSDAFRKKQEDDDYQSGYGGRGYYVNRRLDKDEEEDWEQHQRLKKEKEKRTKKNTPEKKESKPSPTLRTDAPQYEGDEGGGVPSWVRGASLLSGLARKAAGLGTWTMTRPYSGVVDADFVNAVSREFRDSFVGGANPQVLVLADYFDDPRYNGGPEYDVYFYKKADGLYEIVFPATNGKKLIAFLSKALNVKPDA